MDNNKTPITPRQRSLHMPLPHLLTPTSDDDGSMNSTMRPTRTTTGQSKTIDFHPPHTPTYAPAPTSKTTPLFSSSSLSFLENDTEAFVQACMSHLFTVTREISVLWPRLTPAISSYTTTTTTHSNNNSDDDNTPNLLQKCQHLHFEAVELLKAILRAELAGSLDTSVSEGVFGCEPSWPADDDPGSVFIDTLADGAAAGRERLRLGRQVLWLLARWNEVKWLHGVDVDEVGKVDATGAGSGGGPNYEDERHDSGAEMP